MLAQGFSLASAPGPGPTRRGALKGGNRIGRASFVGVAISGALTERTPFSHRHAGLKPWAGVYRHFAPTRRPVRRSLGEVGHAHTHSLLPPLAFSQCSPQ
jgi:hypothetical protein